MTPEHKALVAKLERCDHMVMRFSGEDDEMVDEVVSADDHIAIVDGLKAADAIETLDGQLEILTALVGIVKKESAEWQARAEALIAELRAKEGEIEKLSAKLEQQQRKTEP